MAIIDEPVRGSIPPPWWWSLSGFERIQALARSFIPQPPLCRLLGIRPGHVGPAFCTWTMPATAWLAGPVGELEISLFVEAALTGTAMIAVGPGQTVEPLTLGLNFFRPIRPANGNLVARCRVINASRFFTFVEAEFEDPNGRQLLHASSHAVIQRVEPEPPPVPGDLRPVEEPAYPTPDPYLRPTNLDLPSIADFETGDASEILRSFVDGTRKMPFVELLGNHFVRSDDGATAAAMPASEWLCLFSREGAHGAIATLANSTGTRAALSLGSTGKSFVGLSQDTKFLARARLDGRILRAEAAVDDQLDGRVSPQIVTRDAQGNRVAVTVGFTQFVDAAKRQRTAAAPTKRVLCSLLFTDIVGSTQHAERLGDQKWHELLEEQRKKVRAEISRCNGTEIDTAGDGFFVRFDSPADALDCAAAAIHAVKSLGIEIRAGVHTGECEVTGRNHAGMAVHMGARIMAAAGPGEILVSSTVKDLTMGSGRTFDDRGKQTLKGVPGTWRLYALV